MNKMSAYEADTAWNRGIPFTFFKTLIQFYLFCLFLYSLDYCIKEGIKSNIFDIKQKNSAFGAGRDWNMVNPLQSFLNTNQILFVLFTIF